MRGRANEGMMLIAQQLTLATADARLISMPPRGQKTDARRQPDVRQNYECGSVVERLKHLAHHFLIGGEGLVALGPTGRAGENPPGVACQCCLFTHCNRI